MNNKEIEKIINKKTELLLYGKGEIGKRVFRWLQEQKVENIYGFVVTKADKETMCMNKPVLEVNKVKETYPNVKILICVSSDYREDVLSELKKYGLENYLVLSDLFIDMISQQVYASSAEIDVLNKNISKIYRDMEIKNRNELRLRPRKLLKFEVHITEHCNLNCRGCFHCSPLAKEEFLSVEEYERDCRRLSELYDGDMECIELLGGEPLLHPQINDFFRITRSCFKAGKIVLVTNGLLLLNMNEDFWLSAKKYSIDIAPTRYPINVDYDKIKRKAEQYGIRYSNFYMVTDEKGNKILENYQFDIEGNQSAEANFYKCYRGNYCITLRHGRMYSCAIGAHLHHFKDYFDLESIYISDRNSIDIYSAKSAEEISEFLTQPMPVCRYCKIVDKKKLVPFEQSKRKIEEWL